MRRSLTGTIRLLIVTGVLLVAGIVGTTGWLIFAQYNADIAAGLRSTAGRARLLAEQTSRSMQPIDLTLRDLLGRLTAMGTAVADTSLAWGSKATFDLLVERLKGLPQADFLLIVGKDGRTVNRTGVFPAVRLDLSMRDHFQYLSTNDDHALFASRPVKTFLDNRWTVFLARRLNDPQGSFAGVVLAGVTLVHLEELYRQVTTEHGAVTVLRRDGLVLARYPSTKDVVGTTMSETAPWYKLLQDGGGSYTSPGYMDGIPSLVSVRPLREFPLVIDVSMTKAAALSGWLGQALWLSAGAATAIALVVVLLRVFGIQYSRQVRQNLLLITRRFQFDAVLDNMSQGLTFFDADAKLMISNRRYGEIYRLSADQTRIGTSLSEIVGHRMAMGSLPNMTAADYLLRRVSLVSAMNSFDVIDEFADGRVVSMHYQPMPGGGWVTTHEDITERRRTDASLAFMARHDPLTELPNRTLFLERLLEAMALTPQGKQCALFCLDLDRFKVINDTLGHPVGDALLRAVASRLSTLVRSVDTVARLGGDEFAIIQADLKSTENAVLLAERIVLALRLPYEVDGHRITMSASIGISVAPKDGPMSDALLKNADVALYLAKAEGRGAYRFFEPEIDSYVAQRRMVELELRNARPTEDFELHYQPILDLRSGVVTGFEALIRWNHPIRGMVSPAEFIPIAEETGLIVVMGEWALRKACQEASAWPEDIEIAVNLSPVQFKGAQLVGVVQAALTASGLAPGRLELEVTESVLLEDSDATLAILHQLHALGVRIALDDFGTGYSSLSYLRSFPFDKLKIDRSFICDVDTDNDAAVIVGAVVTIGEGLGMTIVAEGVETEKQLAKVRDQGCGKVQGYFFSRPRPASEVMAMIQTLRVPKPA